jgi:hypothetical protein
MNDDRTLAQARSHMTAVAHGMALKLGAEAAAAVLLGAAVGVLMTSCGAEKAAEYLSALAAALEHGDGDDIAPANHGHA